MSSGNLVKACELSDLEDGEIFQAEVEGVGKLAIYKIGDAVYATDDMCTHGQASLSEDGYIEDGNVICSWHDGAFDIITGKTTALPCMVDLKTYPVEIQGDDVMVGV